MESPSKFPLSWVAVTVCVAKRPPAPCEALGASAEEIRISASNGTNLDGAGCLVIITSS